MDHLTNFPSMLYEVNIVIRPYPQQEIPWHRRKRIAKKWRKKYGPKYHWLKVNQQEILYSEAFNTIYCYPAMADRIRQILKEQGQ